VIATPKGQSEQEANLTKEYLTSPLHRFRYAGSKNYQHICGPSAVLHVSNIGAAITEQDLKTEFEKHGVVKTVKFLSKEKKMALVQMESIEEGT